MDKENIWHQCKNQETESYIGKESKGTEATHLSEKLLEKLIYTTLL